MHAFHRYLASLLEGHLRKHRVVVLYDPRVEFAPFFDEADVVEGGDALSRLRIGDVDCHVARFHGSFFQIRREIEPVVAAASPELLLVYMPGVERDARHSLLMEAELGGKHYHPQLKRLAHEALRKRLTEGQVDTLLEGDVSYQDVAGFLETDGGASVLKAILGKESGERLLVAWLLRPDVDDGIESKGGRGELFALLSERVGLLLMGDEELAAARRSALRYLLVNEFRMGYGAASPGELASVPGVPKAECRARLRKVVEELRAQYPEEYATFARQVQTDVQLHQCAIDPGRLGRINTFPVEEEILLRHSAELLAESRYQLAQEVIEESRESFWVSRDPQRQAQWEVCRRIAALAMALGQAQRLLDRPPKDAVGWVDAYTGNDGLHRVDTVHRRLEAFCTGLDEEPVAEAALASVRSGYIKVLGHMADAFTDALEAGGWSVGRVARQTEAFARVVESSVEPVAYFLVDAFRYEMGLELAANLPEAEELSVEGAVAALPSITAVGMAALMPGASADFSVVDDDGELAAKIGRATLTDWASRWRQWKARVPGVKELRLEKVLQATTSSVGRSIRDAPMVLIRSQEIDVAGESDGGTLARHAMVTVVRNLVRAVRKLAKNGIARFAVVSDHGHLFTESKDDAFKTEPPGGETVLLHRRCWVGRGGSNPPGTVRLAAADLGYDSDLDFIFPRGMGVFKAGGALSYHHGGLSLQEMIVPVLRIRMPVSEVGSPTTKVVLLNTPSVITTRAVGMILALRPELFSEPKWLRVVLMAGSDEVGLAGMVAHGEIDRRKGTVLVAPESDVSVGLILTQDGCESVRIVVLDPDSDSILAQSADIPVRLSI